MGTEQSCWGQDIVTSLIPELTPWHITTIVSTIWPVYLAFELCPVFCYFVGTQVCICGINFWSEISVSKVYTFVILKNIAKWSSTGVVLLYTPSSNFFSQSVSERWYIIAVIVCLFLCVNEIEYLFTYLRPFIVLFLWNVFAHFYTDCSFLSF